VRYPGSCIKSQFEVKAMKRNVSNLGCRNAIQYPLRGNASHVQGHTDRRDGNPLTSSLYCVLEHEGKWLLVLRPFQSPSCRQTNGRVAAFHRLLTGRNASTLGSLAVQEKRRDETGSCM
jgi:hypothetical protein